MKIPLPPFASGEQFLRIVAADSSENGRLTIAPCWLLGAKAFRPSAEENTKTSGKC
jgi:hypothetical protein